MACLRANSPRWRLVAGGDLIPAVTRGVRVRMKILIRSAQCSVQRKGSVFVRGRGGKGGINTGMKFRINAIKILFFNQ